MFRRSIMKDIIRYENYVTSALNLYEINESSNLALCMSNEFLFKENISLSELNIFDNLENSFKVSKINAIDWGFVRLKNFF